MLSLEIVERAPEGFYTNTWDVTPRLFANVAQKVKR